MVGRLHQRSLASIWYRPQPGNPQSIAVAVPPRSFATPFFNNANVATVTGVGITAEVPAVIQRAGVHASRLGEAAVWLGQLMTANVALTR